MRRFRKALCPIVERLICSMMMHGRNNGKKLMAVRIVKHAFEIIHLLTDKNPIQVFVDAVKNGGPREDSTRVGSAGVVRRQAVDVSPLRRVNQAIYLICTSARNSAFRNIKSISECLADEIMNCAKESSNSYAIKKKDEIERVAKANRWYRTVRNVDGVLEPTCGCSGEKVRTNEAGIGFAWCRGNVWRILEVHMWVWDHWSILECSLTHHGLPRKNRWVLLSVGVCFASVCGPRQAASTKGEKSEQA